jgi:thiol-disulfide isomerase/thioredoxin
MKKYWCFFVLLLAAAKGNAQVLEKMLGKIGGYQNIAYTDMMQFQWSFDAEPAFETNKVLISHVASEPKAGGYYKVVSGDFTYSYDGSKVLILNKNDTTYSLYNDPDYGQPTHTILYFTQQLKHDLNNPGKVKRLKDTLYSGAVCYHRSLMVKDSMVKQQRIFIKIDFFVDKRSFLPVAINMSQNGTDDAGTVMGLIEKHLFKNYRFNPSNFPDLSSATIPANYKQPTKKHIDVLANGTQAPAIKLYDLKGKEWPFKNLENKTVLLSFDFVGCPHCIDAEQVLKRLYDKYRDSSVFIAIVYPIDKVPAVLKHSKMAAIRIPSFIADRSAHDSYPSEGYPTFYVINKQGKISGSYVGYSADLQAQLSALIDSGR